MKNPTSPRRHWEYYRTTMRRFYKTEPDLTQDQINELKEIAIANKNSKTQEKERLYFQSMQLLADNKWVRDKRPTYFLQPKLVDFLVASKFDLTSADASQFINQIFSVSWSPDYRFNGQPLSPCLIVVRPEYALYFIPNVINKGEKAECAGYLPYDSKEWKEKPTEVGEFYSELILRFLGYLQAFPTLAHVGFPDNLKARDMRQSEIKQAHHVSLHPKLQACPIAHWRSGHFRTLRAERYNRNPDGSPRVIYVNPMIVGKLTPYTVEEATTSQLGEEHGTV